MFRVNVQESGNFDAAMRQLGKRAPSALARALNRGMVAGRTKAAADVRQDTGLKQKTIRARFTTITATRSRTFAQLIASDRKVPLIEFGAKGPFPSRGRGSVRARGTTYPGAFLMNRRRGGRGVFERVRKDRLPVRQVFGPSVYEAIASRIEGARNRAIEVYESTLQHELEREVSQVATVR